MSGIFEDTLSLARDDQLALTAGRNMDRSGTWRPAGSHSPTPRRRWPTEAKLFAAAAVIASCLVTASVMAVYAMRDYSQTTTMVHRTIKVLTELESADAQLDDSQVAVMSYMIDLDPAHLAQRREMTSEVQRLLGLLSEEIADAGQRRQLDQLKTTMAAHLALQDQVIQASSMAGREAAYQLLVDQRNDASMGAVASIVDAMIAREQLRFDGQEEQEQAKRRMVLVTGALTLILFLGATLMLFVRIRRDLRARTRLGHERDATRRFLESIITAIPHPILIKDARTLSYVLANPAMGRVLNVPVADTIEKDDFTYFPKERAERAAALDRQVLASDEVATHVVRVPTPAQGERTFRTIRLPFHDEAGGHSYLLTVAEDISDMLATEEKLRQMNGTLTKQAEELRTAVGELSRFTYTVSHDLRTPLRAMDGFAQMLSEDYGKQLDDAGRHYINVIRESSQRMGALIDALLYYTRIGRDAPTIVAVDMNQAAAYASRTAADAYPAVTIEWNLTPLPEVPGDRGLLRQVWVNLLTNAVKFSQKADPARIEVRGEFRGHEVVYSVRDNGAGFDPQFSSRLFGLFQRLHSEEPYTGAGVGLAVVQRIVAHHGGRVWAEGVPGAGATFHFSLPRRLRDGSA